MQLAASIAVHLRTWSSSPLGHRYERAGTLGFRCAADVAGSDALDCGSKPLCGRLEAPDASVPLSTADSEWVAWDGAETVRSSDQPGSMGDDRISSTYVMQGGTCVGISPLSASDVL